MTKLLIATTDLVKLAEYQNFLKNYPLQLLSLFDFNIREELEEVGETFEENALLKARFYFNKFGVPTLVDDGGFEVEALNNEPGIKSRRWLGRIMSDEDIIAEILKRMAGESNRNCSLSLALALATSFGVMTSQAQIKGVVAQQCSVTKIDSSPYSSIMYFPNYGKYHCDLNPDEHEILNHRKHALEKIQDMFVVLSDNNY